MAKEKTMYYATLRTTNVLTKGETYYITFPAACSHLFDGVKKCYVLKTDNGKYIIVQPVTRPENMDKPWTHTLSTDGKSKGIRISVTGKVKSGFLPARWFDGTHRKIKRRSKNGSIYICLDEVVA